MVTDRVTTDRDRGQLILIGAITLALLIISIVIVFNGVLFTETLSTGATSQSSSDAGTTEAEITQGLACLQENDGDADDVDEFTDLYTEATTNQQPVVTDIDVTLDELSPIVITDVTITYDSNDMSYSNTITTISSADCPQ